MSCKSKDGTSNQGHEIRFAGGLNLVRSRLGARGHRGWHVLFLGRTLAPASVPELNIKVSCIVPAE